MAWGEASRITALPETSASQMLHSLTGEGLLAWGRAKRPACVSPRALETLLSRLYPDIGWAESS